MTIPPPLLPFPVVVVVVVVVVVLVSCSSSSSPSPLSSAFTCRENSKIPCACVLSPLSPHRKTHCGNYCKAKSKKTCGERKPGFFSITDHHHCCCCYYNSLSTSSSLSPLLPAHGQETAVSPISFQSQSLSTYSA